MIIVSALYAVTRLPGIVALMLAMADPNKPVPAIAYDATTTRLTEGLG